ncbi:MULTISPECIES: type IV secretion system protein VirB3 [unclassified Bartonella]|uniref:type IV secretion system protein VirB3 n=1 Tax=unclassified Bartonella TaxID=2645622 RepID=UPI00099AFB95|nr:MULTISPECIES: type IV secretion system protein VirB3 [unclassified Bartonella]AQX27873.1 type IV secretion system protein VirB3 [Bartonella sp. JB15]AQX27901.1 type IV secretion system protein VirB3 [Bartonella sp. JB15]AQX28660.1 type IV secretion system protein VirB3 [Bartonella sp. JB15]AQX29153.1 type IV secretion system protein VirB3 [Bartonella sp. JB63]AQX29181.1 type IV secretion system protein VirB3 [Bartonella sp. JB63]
MNEDTLFLACTRPAMFAGVTVEAMALNVMTISTLFIITSSFSMIGFGVGLHFILREIIKRDHNQFRVLFAWLNTRGKQKNLTRWGGGSTSPLRLIRTYKELN